MSKIVIIGSGAAGVMCAVQLKKASNHEVILIEGKDRILKKVLQTGNGKCNLTNMDMNKNYYNHAEFIEKMQKKYNVEDLLDTFADLGLMTRVDAEGRVYPYSESAATVVEMFRRAILKYQIETILNFEVIKIKKEKNKYLIFSQDKKVECDCLVIATGSSAQSQQNGYHLLKELGHEIVALRAGLVPLYTKENLSHLQGIKIKCQATMLHGIKPYIGRGEILFKSTGLSGILSLDLSRYYQKGCIVSLDLVPHLEYDALKQKINERLKQETLEEMLMGMFPKMIVVDLLKKNTNDISKLIKNYVFEIRELAGFDQAQIVLGGANIREINEDFSSKLHENLYLIGEVLDIDGACGGFNLSFAWFSAMICAQAMLQKYKL